MQNSNEIRISELYPPPIPPITEDFFPMVHSASLITYHTSIKDIGKLITHSIYTDTASILTSYAPTISASWASSSISASYAISVSYAISASHALLADSASYYPPQQFPLSMSWVSQSVQAWYATRSMDTDIWGEQYHFPYWSSSNPGVGNGDLISVSPMVVHPYNDFNGLLVFDDNSTTATSKYPYGQRPDFQLLEYGDQANAVFPFQANRGIQTHWPITSHTFFGTDQRAWYFSTSSIGPTNSTNSYFSGSAGTTGSFISGSNVISMSGSFYAITSSLDTIFNGKWVRFVSFGGNPADGNFTSNHSAMGEMDSFHDQIMKGLVSIQLQTPSSASGGSGAWNQIDLWVHGGPWGGNQSAAIFHTHNYGPQIIQSFRISTHGGGGIDPVYSIDMLLNNISASDSTLLISAQSWQGIRFLKYLNVDPWPLVYSQSIYQLTIPSAPGYYSNAPNTLNYYIQGKNVVICPDTNELTQSGLAVPSQASTQSLFVHGGIDTNTAFYCDNNMGLSGLVVYGTTNLYFSGGILVGQFPPYIPSGSAIACGGGMKFSGGTGMPNIQEYVTLGTDEGPVYVNYNMYELPDRLQVYMDNNVVLDTGYRGNLSYQTALSAALSNYGSASSAIVISPGSGTLAFYKSTTSSVATCSIFSPLGGTSWNFTMSCPNTTLPAVNGGKVTDVIQCSGEQHINVPYRLMSPFYSTYNYTTNVPLGSENGTVMVYWIASNEYYNFSSSYLQVLIDNQQVFYDTITYPILAHTASFYKASTSNVATVVVGNNYFGHHDFQSSSIAISMSCPNSPLVVSCAGPFTRSYFGGASGVGPLYVDTVLEVGESMDLIDFYWNLNRIRGLGERFQFIVDGAVVFDTDWRYDDTSPASVTALSQSLAHYAGTSGWCPTIPNSLVANGPTPTYILSSTGITSTTPLIYEKTASASSILTVRSIFPGQGDYTYFMGCPTFTYCAGTQYVTTTGSSPLSLPSYNVPLGNTTGQVQVHWSASGLGMSTTPQIGVYIDGNSVFFGTATYPGTVITTSFYKPSVTSTAVVQVAIDSINSWVKSVLSMSCPGNSF